MRLGFLGTGIIASAVVRGLAGQGHQMLVSPRNKARAAELVAELAEVRIAANADVVAQSDVICLGLLAAQAPEVLKPLRFREGQKVVSFMADMALDDVAELVAPAQAVAIMLPYPGIAWGGSPILALGDISVIEDLFAPANRIFEMQSEAQLAAYLAAQAVLSPVAQLVATTADWLADGPAGEAFLRMLVATSLRDQEAARLIDALNTEGGYNQRLRQHMDDAGMRAALRAGLDRL